MKDNLGGAAVQQPPKPGAAARDNDYLLHSDRPSWAWEFLRRNPRYRQAARGVANVKRRTISNISVIDVPECTPDLHEWGLCFAEDADRHYLDGAVFWRADVDPNVLCVSVAAVGAQPGRTGEAIDFRNLKAAVSVLRFENGIELVRLASGRHSIALEVIEGSVLKTPVVLSSHIDGLSSVPAQLATLDRLFTLWRDHKFRKKEVRLDQRRHRWLMALRALDMSQAGLNHRQIAESLFSGRDDMPWRDPGGQLRSRVRRIIGLGQDLANGGYMQILAGRSTVESCTTSQASFKVVSPPPMRH